MCQMIATFCFKKFYSNIKYIKDMCGKKTESDVNELNMHSINYTLTTKSLTSPDNSGFNLWGIHVNVEFPTHQQSNCCTEPRLLLQYLWRLLLHYEGAIRGKRTNLHIIKALPSKYGGAESLPSY